MKFGHRFFIYAPFALFVILAVAAIGRWWIIADAFSKRLDALNGHTIAPGITLHYASKRISGFPFNLDIVFHNIEIDVATPHGPLIWRAPDFAMHRLTYGREQTILEAAGMQKLNWTGQDGKHRSFAFVPGSLRGDTIEDDAGLNRFDLVIVGIGSLQFTAAQLQLHVRVNTANDGLDVFGEADGIRLAPRLHFAFGNEIRLLQLQGTMRPSRPFDGLRAGRSDWVSAMEAWRNANGVFALDAVEITSPFFGAMGKGRLSLDDARRPSGILDFKVVGFSRYVEWRRARHADHESGVTIASALLDRAARAGSDQSGEMGVVLGARDGIVFVGDEPAGMLSPLY